MAKTHCVPNVEEIRKRKTGKKVVSHGTYRCKRKPNSPRCKKKSQ